MVSSWSKLVISWFKLVNKMVDRLGPATNQLPVGHTKDIPADFYNIIAGQPVSDSLRPARNTATCLNWMFGYPASSIT